MDMEEVYLRQITEHLKRQTELQEKTNEPVAPSGGFPHITESIIKPLERAGDLVRQITVAITHHYDAYG